ncbi:hypothetical protein [Paenibacillus xylanexedens]|uniref:hypothetical protein n=1 Tax=Paenibacillus xylanexedens TaxID=528191 RepID=UPI000F52BBF0|nr:hypothetical protein [Paenibacillus xylanexedens]
MNLLETIFTATVSAAVIAAIINTLSNDKNQKLKYITEERAKWRADIKMSASKIYSGDFESKELKTLTTHLMLSLNPLYNTDETLDRTIINLLKKIESGDRDEEVLRQFRTCIGILLKYDWERSKNEAIPWYRRPLDYTIKTKYLLHYYSGKEKFKNEEIE